MEKLLITGGAGFQGRALVKYFLRKGHRITVLNSYSERAAHILDEFKDNITIVWGSVTDRKLVHKTIRNHDCVFHLAARIHVDESMKDPLGTLKVNILGTYNVLESVTDFKTRLIYASSCEVYGSSPRQLAVNEDAQLRPHSPYAASKAAADRLCYSYHMTYGTNVTIVRPFNIFGPYQKNGTGGAVIPIFVDLASRGKPLPVHGSGNQSRDYMYIDDLVQAYDLVYNHGELQGQVINFGTGKGTKIVAIASYIAKKFHVKVIHDKDRPGEVNYFRADISKAKKLGFKPTVDIWSGIDRYIDWHKRVNKR